MFIVQMYETFKLRIIYLFFTTIQIYECFMLVNNIGETRIYNTTHADH